MSTKKKLLEAAAGAAGGGATYVDDVFSTYLYEGNGSTQTITNGIDLAGEGGLVWMKRRDSAAAYNLVDTERGTDEVLQSQATDAEVTITSGVSSFNSTGFSFGGGAGGQNASSGDYTSWTFRKAKNFFDVVTYTGTGSAQTISHNLGSAPGMIIVKDLTTASNWMVYHRSLGGYNYYLHLNTTDSRFNNASVWQSEPTDSTFSVGHPWNNTNGNNYVAYLFAHDAQDFGTDEDESIIKCGSYTGNGSTTGPVINLGFEPQWLMIKRASAVGGWFCMDTMRGMAVDGPGQNTATASIQWQESNPEGTSTNCDVDINPTGFQCTTDANGGNANGSTYIYMAIRRPHKPASELTATDLLESTTYTGNGSSNRKIGSSITADMVLLSDRDATSTSWSSYGHYIYDRIRFENEALATASNGPYSLSWQNTYFNLDQQIGWKVGTNTDYHNKSGTDYVSHHFRRAPGFFDVVAYTGNQTARQIAHNLGVVPEMMWVKCRSQTRNWAVYHASQGNTKVANLNDTGAFTASTDSWNNTSPTSTHFTVGDGATTNFNPEPMIAYLFASVAGISKVGTYTGTGSSLNIDCGFTNGARFVLLKRTDTIGNWFFWDSARGIVSGNEPHLLLNGTSAESSNDYIDPYSAGFNLTGSGSSINGSGGTYIYYAIA